MATHPSSSTYPIHLNDSVIEEPHDIDSWISAFDQLIDAPPTVVENHHPNCTLDFATRHDFPLYAHGQRTRKTPDPYIDKIVKGLRTALETASHRFAYGYTKPEHWTLNYISCGDPTLTYNLPRSELINDTPGQLATHIDELFDHYDSPQDIDRIRLYLGRVGSGKSTLWKYIANCYHNRFNDVRVCPSRVESSKLLKFVNAPIPSDRAIHDISLFITRCACRDFYRFAFFRYEDNYFIFDATNFGTTIGDNDSLLAQYYEAHKDAYRQLPPTRFHHICNRIKEIFLGYDTDHIERFRQTISFFKTIDPYFARLSVAFAISRGYRFHLIFDGFDYVEADDTKLETERAKLLSIVGKQLFDVQDFCELIPAELLANSHVAILMRYSTLSHFCELNKRDIQNIEVKPYSICPPGLVPVWQRYSARVARTIRVDDVDIPRFSRALTHLQRRFSATFLRSVYRPLRDQALSRGSAPLEYRHIFNGNIRFQFEFIARVSETMSYVFEPRIAQMHGHVPDPHASPRISIGYRRLGVRFSKKSISSKPYYYVIDTNLLKINSNTTSITPDKSSHPIIHISPEVIISLVFTIMYMSISLKVMLIFV